MPPTLANLVQHSALGLSVLAGQERLDRAVRWAHVSELTDPTPYLDGGELLLLTALKLDVTNSEAMDAYVRRLVDKDVVGIGFAAGVHYEQVPDALLQASKSASLPLIEVPRRTPFLAISKVVSDSLAAERYRSVTAGFDAQRELTSAALSHEGPAALLGKLAQHLDGWVALYDASAAVVASAPHWAARRAARITTEVQRLRDRPAPASAVVSGGEVADDRIELQSVGVGSGRRARAVLAIGTGAPLGTGERYAVNSAIALLTLTTERSRALQEAEGRLGAAVLRMLLVGESNHARAVAGRLYGGLLDAPLRVVVAEEGGSSLEGLGEAIEAAAARAGEAVLLVPDGGRLVVLAADGGSAVEGCIAYAEAADRCREKGGQPEAVIGISAPAGLAAAAVAFKQAEQALSVARRRGVALVEHEDVAAGSVMPLLADDAVRAFADGMLRALHEHDATGRGNLVESLREWLAHHGQWDAAAAKLRVHRHTLRYRMRRVEEILGRSLDDPDVRMELWLALKATSQ
ncbi:PucR family transcriptional regulator [Streptomyces sp. NPDC005438]|uniref:PucR family transcriptional regulator n=1 Tax=Streptomyces sp. NPDC005438 TaxID=3156880 RepID=UPI0033BE6847